jgi:predicted dehydrogenase
MTKRRDFIKKSTFGSAGIAIGGMGLSAKSYGLVDGANERLNVAVIGTGGRGGAHVRSWCSLKDSKNVNLRTVCDVDELLCNQKAALTEKLIKLKPLTESDMRRVFDDKDIHAVSFATPNHWHALGTIWACQAGKHVYVEKPASHNIFEGRKMVEAANKYNVRVQAGFQARSYKNINDAIRFLHEGGIGEVYMARGQCYKPRDSFGIVKNMPPPVTLHYEKWLGPAPYRQYNEKRLHYNWHWFWDTGNGDSGNQGVHEFDIARWGLNKNEHPVSVYSTGGIYGINPAECAQETPNTQASVFKYKDGKIIEFETRGRYTNFESNMSIDIGVLFYGTEGYLELKAWDESGDKWKAYRRREKEPFAGSESVASKDAPSLTGSDSSEHFINFIDSIRSGKSEDLHCEINEGHFSTVLSHLANISFRLGRELKFMGDYEKFANDSEADTMLSRDYRKPYVVPEIV